MFKYISALLLLLPQICFSYNSSSTYGSLSNWDNSPYLAVLEWLLDDSRSYQEVETNDTLAELAIGYAQSDFKAIAENWVRDSLYNSPRALDMKRKEFEMTMSGCGLQKKNKLTFTDRLFSSDKYKYNKNLGEKCANFHAKYAYAYDPMGSLYPSSHEKRLEYARECYQEVYDSFMSN